MITLVVLAILAGLAALAAARAFRTHGAGTRAVAAIVAFAAAFTVLFAVAKGAIALGASLTVAAAPASARVPTTPAPAPAPIAPQTTDEIIIAVYDRACGGVMVGGMIAVSRKAYGERVWTEIEGSPAAIDPSTGMRIGGELARCAFYRFEFFREEGVLLGRKTVYFAGGRLLLTGQQGLIVTSNAPVALPATPTPPTPTPPAASGGTGGSSAPAPPP